MSKAKTARWDARTGLVHEGGSEIEVLKHRNSLEDRAWVYGEPMENQRENERQGGTARGKRVG